MAENNQDDRDINIRAVTKFGLGVGALLIGSILLMWFVFDRFAARETRESPRPDTMASSNPRTEPPEPRLQPAPVMDLKAVQAAEDLILHSYGWIDPDKGLVRIPVERAMELVLKEGLPSRKEVRNQ
jgi:hypothetical protein